jgi:hypothetical protein
MQTNTLTGEVNDEMLERAQKILQMLFGKKVRIVIEEDNGEKKRKGR